MPIPLRFVIIGSGAGVFQTHAHALSQTTGQLVAIAGRTEPVGRARAIAHRCLYFADYRQMLADVRPDVAVIITPHPAHAMIAIDCVRAGCHVLLEKPPAIEMAEVDKLIAAADQAERFVAVCFQHRARPEIQAARDLIQAGALGQLQRMEIVSPWTRTRSYYRSATWRGTWRGEGGGVLLNQASHDLDLLCYLLGPPRHVQAWTRTRWHAIEAEDTVHSILEWDDGLLGYFQASTAEGWPGLRRFDIVGTRGFLRIGSGQLVLEQSTEDLRGILDASSKIVDLPPTLPREIAVNPHHRTDHLAIYDNLIAALSGSAPLLADVRSAAQSLELANAMTLASHRNQQITLPLNREQYHELLIQLQTNQGMAA